MKKLSLMFCAVILAGSSLYAQGVSAGLKAGLNFANMKFSGDGASLTPDSRTSFHFGGFVTAMVTESFGVQPELLYNSVGSKFSLGTVDATYKLSYISVPVLLRYNPVKVFNLHAGPQFGLLLGGKMDVDGDEEDVDNLKSLDMGLAFGAGVDLPMGLTASLRYTLGLSNINDDADDDSNVKNNVIQLSVGFKLVGAGD